MVDKKQGSSPSPEEYPTSPDPIWQRFLATAAATLRSGWDMLEGIAPSPEEREKLARLLREVFDRAIEVPPDLYKKLKEDVARRPAAERVDPVMASWNRTRACARRTAGVGAVTTIPMVAPGFGPAIAALGLVADWRYVAEQQRNLVLEIAALFEVELENPSEEVRLLFLLSTGVAYVDTAVGALVSKELAKRAGQEIARRALVRMAPVAGAAVAGSLNYTATLALGRAAITRFAREAGVEISDQRWAREHPALNELRQAVTAAVSAAEEDQLKRPVIPVEMSPVILELSTSEREELLELALARAGHTESPSPAQQEALAEIAAALGFSEPEVAKTRAAMERTFTAHAQRVSRLLRAGGSAVSSGTGNVWRKSLELARRGWYRAARRGTPGAESSDKPEQ
jgi:uncharacterized protein (DUF697 family)